MGAGPPLAEVYEARGGDGASVVAGTGCGAAPDAKSKPFTDPRTAKALHAVDRVVFAVATLPGRG